MRCLYFIALLLLIGCRDTTSQKASTVPLGITPDELLKRLRDDKVSDAERRAIEIEPIGGPASEVSLRYVQLDADADWEAILTHVDEMGYRHRILVMDKQAVWRIVGSFSCIRYCATQELVRTQKLTVQSPRFFLLKQDLGGSGSVFVTAEVFGLRGGRLTKVLEIREDEHAWNGEESVSSRRQLYAGGDVNLVIHTLQETERTKRVTQNCEVQRWDVERFAFVPAPQEKRTYCESATGQPVQGKSYPVALLK